MPNIDTTLLAQLRAIEWQYGDKDPQASREIAERIAKAGQQQKQLRYSELANGITFHPPNINNGAPYHIHVFDWHGLDRRIIGDHLGYLSFKSYELAGFLTSAIVVAAIELQPSDIFFSWMKELGALRSMSEDDILKFWITHTKAAFRWYRENKGKPVV